MYRFISEAVMYNVKNWNRKCIINNRTIYVKKFFQLLSVYVINGEDDGLSGIFLNNVI